MAKAKEITGLDCSANAVDWAAQVLRVRFEEVCELRDGALDFSEVEGVHAMRVATRRLRGALRNFQPLLQKHPLRQTKEELKTIARTLGAVRDEDVAIMALEELLGEAPTEQINEGIEIFLNERRATRDNARFDLTKALDASKLYLLQANFSDSIKPRKQKHLSEVSFNEAGRLAVRDSLNEFCKLGSALYAPCAVTKLHEMRIAAKELRYAVELFTNCWGDKIEPFAEQIARMQDALGKVHDCDVWSESLGKRLRNNRETEIQGSIWLLSKFTKKRTAGYRDALKIWSRWQASDFERSMLAVVDSAA